MWSRPPLLLFVRPRSKASKEGRKEGGGRHRRIFNACIGSFGGREGNAIGNAALYVPPVHSGSQCSAAAVAAAVPKYIAARSAVPARGRRLLDDRVVRLPFVLSAGAGQELRRASLDLQRASLLHNLARGPL